MAIGYSGDGFHDFLTSSFFFFFFSFLSSSDTVVIWCGRAQSVCD